MQLETGLKKKNHKPLSIFSTYTLYLISIFPNLEKEVSKHILYQ